MVLRDILPNILTTRSKYGIYIACKSLKDRWLVVKYNRQAHTLTLIFIPIGQNQLTHNPTYIVFYCFLQATTSETLDMLEELTTEEEDIDTLGVFITTMIIENLVSEVLQNKTVSLQIFAHFYSYLQ